MTTANTTIRRGRPNMQFHLANDEINNAVHATVRYNAQTGEYDYQIGNKISGSSQSIDYLRRRIMRGQLKDLNTISNNFVRAFALHIIDENGNQTVQYVKRTSK